MFYIPPPSERKRVSGKASATVSSEEGQSVPQIQIPPRAKDAKSIKIDVPEKKLLTPKAEAPVSEVHKEVKQATDIPTAANQIPAKPMFLLKGAPITKENLEDFTKLIDSNPELLFEITELSCSSTILSKLIIKYKNFPTNILLNIRIDTDEDFVTLNALTGQTLRVEAKVRLDQIVKIHCATYNEKIGTFLKQLTNLKTLSIGTYPTSIYPPGFPNLEHLEIDTLLVQEGPFRLGWMNDFRNLKSFKCDSIKADADKVQAPKKCYMSFGELYKLESIRIGTIDLPNIETQIEIGVLPELKTLDITSSKGSSVDLDIPWFECPNLTLNPVATESAGFFTNWIRSSWEKLTKIVSDWFK